MWASAPPPPLPRHLPSSPARLAALDSPQREEERRAPEDGTVEVVGGRRPAAVALVTVLHRAHADAQR